MTDELLAMLVHELIIANRLRAIELNNALNPSQMGQDYPFIMAAASQYIKSTEEILTDAITMQYNWQ